VRWTPRAPIPDKRGWFGAALLDGKIYCAGGKCVRTEQEKRDSGDARQYEYRASLNIYDPAADRWTAGAPMRAPRAGCCAAALDGKLYVIGGSETNSGFLDRVEIYDPATKAWQDGPSIPEGREDMGAAAVDGKIYAMGGVKHSVRGDVYIFDPKAGRWTAGAAMPTPRRSFAVVADGPRLWCIGGVPGSGYTNVVEVYDTRANRWSSGPAHPQAKAWMGAALLDGRLYTVGGANQDQAAKRYNWLGEAHMLSLPIMNKQE
jgi:kelch-like protein 17 (actinfilin)/kelch-like protein 20